MQCTTGFGDVAEVVLACYLKLAYYSVMMYSGYSSTLFAVEKVVEAIYKTVDDEQVMDKNKSTLLVSVKWQPVVWNNTTHI